MDERKSEAMTTHDERARAKDLRRLLDAYITRDGEWDTDWQAEALIEKFLREAEARGLEDSADHKEECNFAGQPDDTISWCRAQAASRRGGG